MFWLGMNRALRWKLPQYRHPLYPLFIIYYLSLLLSIPPPNISSHTASSSQASGEALYIFILLI